MIDGLIKVCGWCYPKDSIYEVYPHWRGLGLDITHGICKMHKRKMLMDLVKKGL